MRRSTALISVLSAVLLSAPGTVGTAATSVTDADAAAIEELEYYFGPDAEAAYAELAADAKAQGITTDSLVEARITEIEQNNADTRVFNETPPVLEPRPQADGTAAMSTSTSGGDNREAAPASDCCGGDDDREPMINANYRGDFFYYPASSWGINHGHLGIYRWPGAIVEAANANLGVRKVLVSQRDVPKDKTYLFWVRTSFAKQQNAADWSQTKVGADYRPWHSRKNKYIQGPYNCSQLVWAAYGVHDFWLDKNGGDYVWPIDIADHKLTDPYKKV